MSVAHILQRVHNEIIDATKGSQRPVVQGPDSSLMLRLDDPAVTAGTPLGRDIISHEQLFRQSKDTYDEIIDGLEQHPATIPSPTGAGQDGESLASSRVAESQAHKAYKEIQDFHINGFQLKKEGADSDLLPPPPPPAPEEMVRLAKENIYYNNKKISAEKARELIKKKDQYDILLNSSKGSYVLIIKDK